MIGNGWLGRAIAVAAGTLPVPRRRSDAFELPDGCRVVVASGRGTIPATEGLAKPLRQELGHVRAVIEAAEAAHAVRIVVLGSSDVAGYAARIDSRAPQDPRSTYAQVKAAIEDECVAASARGLPVTCVRLAPVHGPGKKRSAALVRLSRLPLVPLPNGGRHSTGFVSLDDAVQAVLWLTANDAPAVQSVGGGPTPLCDLLRAMAAAQGRPLRSVFVPVPASALARRLPAATPDSIQWASRLASPRHVVMEPPLIPMPLHDAARFLVNAC